VSRSKASSKFSECGIAPDSSDENCCNDSADEAIGVFAKMKQLSRTSTRVCNVNERLAAVVRNNNNNNNNKTSNDLLRERERERERESLQLFGYSAEAEAEAEEKRGATTPPYHT